VARSAFGGRQPRYLVINTGNANAGTGRQGLADAEATCRGLAERTGCHGRSVAILHRGDRRAACRWIGWSPVCRPRWRRCGPTVGRKPPHGIMTTDTRPKWASRRTDAGNGREVTVTGIAKGAGMICPDMATLLALSPPMPPWTQHCCKILHEAVADSFNAITVDGDTSTNDPCVLLATGQSGVEYPAIRERSRLFR
jgi:glutamate N-acetyltransferase/amino-acid N-acetyltransferase